MARSNYSAGKRQREREKERKKKEKAERQRDRSTGGGGDIPIATADEIQGGSMMSVEEVMRSVHGRNNDADRAHTIPSRLFVGGLNWRVTADQLRSTLEEFGPVTDVIIVTDRDTGDSRGFGFVTMADRKDAAEAIRKLDGKDLEGRTLVVRQATERQR
jgi:RNA recognition motif-containing protein